MVCARRRGPAEHLRSRVLSSKRINHPQQNTQVNPQAIIMSRTRPQIGGRTGEPRDVLPSRFRALGIILTRPPEARHKRGASVCAVTIRSVRNSTGSIFFRWRFGP